MYHNLIKEKITKMSLLKSQNDFENYNLTQLRELPSYDGIYELEFSNNKFLMLNIKNDDAVPLKYYWRNGYEILSLKIWHALTRGDKTTFDVGAHTGIYSIISNLNKNTNNNISIEPFQLNFYRLISNLKLNNISPKCYMGAATDKQGQLNFEINTKGGYHTSGGKISDAGKIVVRSIKLDNFKIDNDVVAIKIDTEGHEARVLNGSINIINKFKPNIIYEINEKSFDESYIFLEKFGYKFFFIDEKAKDIFKINKFDKSLLRAEGSNCIASANLEISDLIKYISL
tara:strand:+ start:306 stop:1163 length:858 start_codon:yes stop_codon:yes gene_type:complete